ncbi:helix-turn-helix transcriptional regulator [Dapis sp. BLCC M229]|uniref:helix-turn-helix transcriptional regulator n=1 Tax=Dapis sp. BLCC M229 TaxID=3400188 RepID=UPI003CF35988
MAKLFNQSSCSSSVIYKSNDPDEFADTLALVTGPIQLLPLEKIVDFKGRVNALMPPHIKLFKVNFQGVQVIPEQNRSYIAISFVTGGLVELVQGSQVYKYDHKLAIGHNPTDLLKMRCKHSEMLVAMFDLAFLDAYAQSLGEWAKIQPVKIPIKINLASPHGRSLYQSLSFLWQQFEQVSPLLNSPLAISEYERFLLSQLFYLEDGVADLPRSTSRSSLLTLSRAEDYIIANLNQPLTIEAIAGTLGVSPSTLFKVFKDKLKITPMQFVKRQRLQKVREALLLANPQTSTVVDIASRYGFWNSGRFAAEYRKLFHENPTETLRR